MSELNFYLLVTLASTVCGFFMGMGYVLVLNGHELEQQKKRSPEAKLAFLSVCLLGSGYLIAWLWASHQPMFKLIPILILAFMAGNFGGSLTKDGIGPRLPLMGLLIIPTMFHVSSYFWFP
ncbi:hypothetical protein [Halomonas sp. AOP43-F2-13]|uniref:hypothetical protein n=1 Tax=Halomonas sp. AOP43-F2-13 TaxID=3457657 RepID=UPI004033A7D9